MSFRATEHSNAVCAVASAAAAEAQMPTVSQSYGVKSWSVRPVTQSCLTSCSLNPWAAAQGQASKSLLAPSLQLDLDSTHSKYME